MYELTFLPGLEEVVRDEVAEVLGERVTVRPVPGREDSLLLRHQGPPADLLALRTVVAVSLVMSFPVPRPKSLTSGEYFPRIVDAVRGSARLDDTHAFRFEAAGKDSTVFRLLAGQLAQATHLRYDDSVEGDGPSGTVVLRFRRTPLRDEGWDVLVRLGGRPSSARSWRVADYPGAVNATVAAAVVRLAGVRAKDRVANLMCGSGTLLVERLLAGRAAAAVGVDVSDDAIAAAVANVAAAGLQDRVELVTADVRDSRWRGGAPYDLLLADPPWGTLMGSHATNEDLYRDMLQAAYEVSRPGARFAVLTHEVKLMDRVLRETSWWQVRDVVRVFQKGHHPRVYLLDRAERAGAA